MLIQHALFYIFAALAIGSGLCMIFARNPVHSALFLVAAFVSAAVLWILLEAEFLGLALIFVYVGAVMTLFLFVVMMLDTKSIPRREGFVRYLPIALLVVALLVLTMLIVVAPQHFYMTSISPPIHGEDYSNTKALGDVLYTDYAYAFELAAVLLLVAIVAAISLGFRGRKRNTKAQRPQDQISVRREDRIRLVKMTAENRLKNL